MRSLRPWLLNLAGVLAFAGCSLLLRYDPAGQPCDDQGKCLTGFSCSAGEPHVCLALDGGEGPCGTCAAGQRCPEGATACVNDDCASRICPVGTACSGDPGATSCAGVLPPALGQSCTGDSTCGGSNRFCWRGAVQVGSSGALRPGVCVEPCSAGRTCLAAGATCKDFAVGLDAGGISLCVPATPFFTPCESDGPCAAEGLVCTIYDHPKVGPATLCDRPLAGGKGAGAECSASQLCANGLCVPRIPAPLVPATCGQVCSSVSCPSGSTCVLSEFGVQDQDGLRHLPLCVPVATTCADCSASVTPCGADAPHCTPMGSTSRCLAECTPDAGSFPECPHGLKCALLSKGPRCIPESGICP